jgi:hypothetical protein
MKEFKKFPIWKPGRYSEFIKDSLKINDEHFIFEKGKFEQKIKDAGLEYSKYGVAYDLHELYKALPGKIKSQIMNNNS